MTRYKQIKKGYWHNELEKAQKAFVTIEDSNIANEIKEYICQILKVPYDCEPFWPISVEKD